MKLHNLVNEHTQYQQHQHLLFRKIELASEHNILSPFHREIEHHLNRSHRYGTLLKFNAVQQTVNRFGWSMSVKVSICENEIDLFAWWMCTFALSLKQMTRYKQADFADEDTSSIGSRSIHLNETTTIPSMHIRYHTTQVSQSQWANII